MGFYYPLITKFLPKHQPADHERGGDSRRVGEETGGEGVAAAADGD